MDLKFRTQYPDRRRQIERAQISEISDLKDISDFGFQMISDSQIADLRFQISEILQKPGF
jgi:hypothetical protein